MPDPYGTEYRDRDWPHGLRCATCARRIAEGDRWARQWHSFMGAVPVLLVVCLECALGEPDE